MKKVILLVSVMMLFASVCQAKVKYVGQGDQADINPATLPANMQAGYHLLKTKCVKCHSLERTILAIQTGIEPITSQTFDKNAIRAYGEKMLHKKNSNMNRQEVKSIVELLNYLVSDAAKK